MKKYKDTIEVIVRLVIKREGKILLCLNKGTSSYFLPGGHVEFGDTFEQTIYKEMAEELGWSKEDIKSIKFKNYLENSYEDNSGLHSEVNMIFDVEIGDEVETESKEDHIGFEWMNVSEIPKLNILPATIVNFVK